jgi:hypothetical protein
VQTALTFGTAGGACTAMGSVAQAIYENEVSPTGLFTPASATTLLRAVQSLDAALGCTVPSAAEFTAAAGLIKAIGDLENLGVDPGTTGTLAGQLEQAGQSFVVGDDGDGCMALQLLTGSISLYEMAATQGQPGLTAAQGNAIAADIQPAAYVAGC